MAGRCPFHFAEAAEAQGNADAAAAHSLKPNRSTSSVLELKESYSDGYWNIGPQYGFMPAGPPLEKLPERYAALQNLTDSMPIVKANGEPGYLATPGAIDAPVQTLTVDMDAVRQETDMFVLAALFRALTFVASAYLLEPSHHSQGDDGSYGKARTLLPRTVAEPLVYVSDKLGVYPFLEYHYAYSLGNHIQIEKGSNYEWNNLRMACAFSGKKDESGFIMLHVDIVSHSAPLLSSIWNFVKQPSVSALRANYEAMLVINERRKHMWEASDWRRYNDFRVFIMGIKGNTRLFNDGVVYEGSFDNKPQQYRGQSGSQDDIVPCEDIFTGVIDYYPDNELTRYLIDMRSYRPPPVREFFSDLQNCNFNLETFAALGRTALIYLLAIVDQIYVFRNGHWQFVQKYILSTTRYPVATGGTPITSWLPNQIDAVLKYQTDILARIDSMPSSKAECEEAKNSTTLESPDELLARIRDTLPVKLSVLAGQREELAKPDYDPTVVHNINPEDTLEYSRSTCPMHL